VANVLVSEENGRKNGLPIPKLDSDYLASLELPKKIGAWRKLLDSDPAANIPPPAPERASAPPTPRVEREPLPKSKLIALAGLAAVILAFVVLGLMGRKHPSAAPSAPPVAAQTAPAPAETPPAEAAPAGSAFDTVKLQAIIYSTGHPVALINGKSLDIGGHVNGMEVIAIERSNVVLAYNGQQKSFALK
jgi:hypothetical protein